MNLNQYVQGFHQLFAGQFPNGNTIYFLNRTVWIGLLLIFVQLIWYLVYDAHQNQRRIQTLKRQYGIEVYDEYIADFDALVSKLKALKLSPMAMYQSIRELPDDFDNNLLALDLFDDNLSPVQVFEIDQTLHDVDKYQHQAPDLTDYRGWFRIMSLYLVGCGLASLFIWLSSIYGPALVHGPGWTNPAFYWWVLFLGLGFSPKPYGNFKWTKNIWYLAIFLVLMLIMLLLGLMIIF